MESLKPPRAPIPWFKLILMLIALGIVFWLIYTLNNISTSHLIEATPDVEELSPTPETIDFDVQDEIAPPPADDPPEEAAAAPHLPGDLPEPSDDLQRMFLDRVRNTITLVYDGDTVQLADGTRVRYIGIDTPERDEPYYREATAFNRRLVEMKTARMEVCRKRPNDGYGRTLARVFVEGQWIEETLLQFGWAEVFHDPDCVRDCRPGWKIMLQAFRHRKGIFAEAATEPVPAMLADRLLSSYGLVTGIVDNVKESTKAYHLNFGTDWTTDFSATIERKNLPDFLRDRIFPDQLVGKEVTLFGKVISSYGPRIFLVCPAQVVRIVDSNQ